MNDVTLTPPEDDPLDRAVSMLKREPMPEGPSAELLQQTLAALHDRPGASATPQRSRSLSMFTLLKVAASVAFATAGLTYLAFPPTETFAFGEVAARLKEAHTLSYQVSVTAPGLPTAMKMTYLFKEPGRLRVESGNTVSILDAATGKQVLLDKASKTALTLAIQPSPATAALDLVQGLRSLTAANAKPIGKKPIGDVEADGFLVNSAGNELTVWVNPATRLPVRIEATMTLAGKPTTSICDQFQVDPPLDDRLFDVSVPEGYARTESTLPPMETDPKTFLVPEKAVEALLKAFVAKTGRFPKKLDDPSEFDKAFPMKKGAGPLPDAETLRVVQTLTRFLMASQPLKGQFTYRGETITPGDAAKPVFWYKPAGRDTFRVLYADWHVDDLPAEKLPKP